MVNFIVEDGSIVTGANSYCTVSYYLQYWENRGSDFSSCSPDSIKSMLISATEKTDQNSTWKGCPTTIIQDLDWPRTGMYDCRGNAIDSDEIPDDLKNAVCQMSAYMKENGDPDLEEQGIKSKSLGPLSVTYLNGGQIKIKTVDKALKCFVKPGFKSVRV